VSEHSTDNPLPATSATAQGNAPAAVADVVELPEPPDIALSRKKEREFQRFAMLLGTGWISTNIGYSIADLPVKFMLKDQLHCDAKAVAAYFAIGEFTNYIKPLAGILTDSVPLFGTRRRYYLLLSLLACGLMWLVYGMMPRRYGVLLATYTFLHVFIVFISTTLGGIMAEGGERFRASGRLSSQRVGIMRVVSLIGGPVGGWLATRPFTVTASITAAFHFILLPLYYFKFREPTTAQVDTHAVEAIKAQGRALFRNRALWSAAGLIFLIEIAPGFNTPLLYYQTDTLGFAKTLVGLISSFAGGASLLGAVIFNRLCRKYPLRPMLWAGIIIHVFAALLYLGYRTPQSAIWITVCYSAAQTLAVLPLYDLAVRATPKGSEALGYAVMMSVFNITLRLSDYIGSMLFTKDPVKVFGVTVLQQGVSFNSLIWLNAITTALVLVAIPLLPRTLTDHRDGEEAA
jgi:Na+/melibiose symporter-like transporter